MERRHEVVRLVEGALCGRQELLEASPEAVSLADIVLDRMRTEGKLDLARRMSQCALPAGASASGVLLDHSQPRGIPPAGVLLSLRKAWESLALTSFPSQHGMSERRIRAAQVCVFNRLVDPCSENSLLDWVSTMALDELLGDSFCHYARDVFYRAGDDLLEHSQALEKHLCERESTLFSLGGTILLYDLSNNYFEGECPRNPKARRSMNRKEKRTDCRSSPLDWSSTGRAFPSSTSFFRETPATPPSSCHARTGRNTTSESPGCPTKGRKCYTAPWASTCRP